MTQKEREIPLGARAALSIFFWFLVSVLTILYSVAGLFLIAPLSLVVTRESRNLIHSVAVLWGRSLLAVNPLWRLRVEGREHVTKGRTYVIVSNHQSMLDIMIVLAGVSPPFKFMAKDQLFVIPFIGWHMAVAGYIPLDRASHESGRAALQKAREWLRKGVSVLFFPEGTRSLDGQIHDFKLGAFKLAHEERIEILPLVIDGTGDAVPKKSWYFEKTSPFFLSIGRPVALQGEGVDRALETRDRIRREMMERLARIRAAR